MRIACKGVSRRTCSMEFEVNKRIGHENRCPPGIGTVLPLYSCESKILSLLHLARVSTLSFVEPIRSSTYTAFNTSPPLT